MPIDVGAALKAVSGALSQAKQAVQEAVKHNRAFGIMSAVTAAGAVGSAVLALFGRPEVAIFGVAFVIAFMFVLLVFLAAGDRPTKSRRRLADTLAWAFSGLMVAAITLLMTSFFFCWPPLSFSQSCSAPIIPRVSIDDLRRLDEKYLRLDGRAFLLDKVALKSYEIEYDPDATESVSFPVELSLSNFGQKPDKSIDLSIILLAGTSAQDLQVVRREEVVSPKWWETTKLVANVPGGANSVSTALAAQNVSVRPGGFPSLWAVSCFTKEQVKGGKAVVRFIVFDRVTEKYRESEDLAVSFVPKKDAKSLPCPFSNT